MSLPDNVDRAWLAGGFAYYSENSFTYPLDSNIGATVQVGNSTHEVVVLNDNVNSRTLDFYIIIEFTTTT